MDKCSEIGMYTKIAETSRVVAMEYETVNGGIEGGNINYILNYRAFIE